MDEAFLKNVFIKQKMKLHPFYYLTTLGSIFEMLEAILERAGKTLGMGDKTITTGETHTKKFNGAFNFNLLCNLTHIMNTPRPRK